MNIFKRKIALHLLYASFLLKQATLPQWKQEIKDQIKDLQEDIKSITDENERESRQDQLKILLDYVNYSDFEESDVPEVQQQLDEIMNDVQEIEDQNIQDQESEPWTGGEQMEPGQPTGPTDRPGPGMHPQDDSTERLMTAVQNGYTHCVWNLHESHPREDVCNTLHKQVFTLEDMVLNLQHNAPIFEKSHVGCRCWLLVYSEYNADLPWIIIDWGGRWA